MIDWYLPGYKAGGPIQSCANIIKHLGKEFEFYVATSDRDLGDTKAYPGVDVNHWNKLEDGTPVYYFGPGTKKIMHLQRVITELGPDVIYLNSMFSFFFTLYPLLIRKMFGLKCKFVLAPRGMLGKGALGIKSNKKELFLKTSKVTGLYRNVLWHASTETESDEIKKVFGDDARVLVARNLTAPRTVSYQQKPKVSGVLKLFFLSRISLKKNLLEAIEILMLTDQKHKIEFDIWGPVDDKEYWQNCLEKIKSLPENVKCNYKGSVSNNEVFETISAYHALLLPTRHENFGHAIVESLAASCPVIISDQTPWRNLSEKNAGWDIPLAHAKDFSDAINKLADLDQEAFSILSRGAFELGNNIINDETILQQNRNLFINS